MGGHDRVPPVPDPADPPFTRGVVLTKAAAVYDLLSPPMLFWQEQPINRRGAAYLQPQPDALVLDVGCATGGMTLAIAEYLTTGLAVGIDASPPMVAQARKKVNKHPCRFDIGLAEALPYPAETFDAVVSTFFFHHLNLADKQRALGEMFRVLKPAGDCVIIDIDIPTNLIGRLSCWGATTLFRQPEISENAQGKLAPLFPANGFRQVRRRAHNLGYLTTYSMVKPPTSLR